MLQLMLPSQAQARIYGISFIPPKLRRRIFLKKPWNKTPMLIRYARRISRPLPYMDRRCLERLRGARVPFRLLKGVVGVRTPVKLLTYRLGGVTYRRAWNNKTAPWILDCKTVENLILAGPRLRRAGIATIYWNSAWRFSFVHHTRRLSRHAYGEALDITAIDGSFGYASVIRHYERGRRGCGSANKTRRGAALRRLVCAFTGDGLFKTAFTPDYNRIHRDHIHIDHPGRRFKLKVKPRPFGRGAASDAPAPRSSAGSRRSADESDSGICRGRGWKKCLIRKWWEPPRSRPRYY